MDVCVRLLADDVWAAENYRIGFLVVGVDIFGQLYLKERPIYFPMVPVITIKQNIEKTQQIEIWDFLMNDQNITFGYTPPIKTRKSKKANQLILMNV